MVGVFDFSFQCLIRFYFPLQVRAEQAGVPSDDRYLDKFDHWKYVIFKKNYLHVLHTYYKLVIASLYELNSSGVTVLMPNKKSYLYT